MKRKNFLDEKFEKRLLPKKRKEGASQNYLVIKEF